MGEIEDLRKANKYLSDRLEEEKREVKRLYSCIYDLECEIERLEDEQQQDPEPPYNWRDDMD